MLPLKSCERMRNTAPNSAYVAQLFRGTTCDSTTFVDAIGVSCTSHCVIAIQIRMSPTPQKPAVLHALLAPIVLAGFVLPIHV